MEVPIFSERTRERIDSEFGDARQPEIDFMGKTVSTCGLRSSLVCAKVEAMLVGRLLLIDGEGR